MKILYGVQATGNGHIARARVMARAFARRGMDVDYLLSGRPRDQLFATECFGDFALRKGLTFDVKGGRIRYVHTTLKLPLARAVRDVLDLDVGRYDLVISDFEPVTAWAAKIRGTPSLGISHQCAFHYDITKDGANPIAQGVLKAFAPVKYHVGLHWDSFGFPIIPPLVDLENSSTDRIDPDPDKILVYLPFEEPADILSLLSSIDTHRFVVYMGLDAQHSRGNVEFRPYDKTAFQRDLRSSSGVICNAGFELPSECIHLGKRLLVKPVWGQMEQLSNARALTLLGLGNRVGVLSRDSIGEWLCRPAPPPRPFGNVADGVVQWIDEGHLTRPEALSKRLWDSIGWRVSAEAA